jgi:hypothetical protein
MLELKISEKESWDESKNEFRRTNSIVLSLEHSLVSVSKWESIWHKPFIGNEKKTRQEALSYIKCMTITQNVPDDVYSTLSEDEIKQINAYINDTMTATFFNENAAQLSGSQSYSSSSKITSELIYYWMISFQIPFECQKWHLNRLLTLIRICNIKNQNQSSKGMSRRDIYAQNAALNAARRKMLNSKG